MCLVFEPRVPSYDSRGRARGPGARDRSSSARSIHDVSIRGRPSTPSPPELDELRARLQQTSVSFGIPSFNEGAGVVHTLQSVLEAASSLGLRGVTVILSDSSETTETVDAARAWAQQKDVQLLVDRSERRRSAKEARNVLMARASSEILVQVDADVVLPAASLFHVLSCLTEPAPKVAIGTTLPDPRVRGLAYGAARWQL